MNETTPSPLENVITIDDDRIKSHLGRGDVERWLRLRGGSVVLLQL
jgi:hypothetical protein